jgi:type IV secretory pathway TrbD component
MEPGITAGLLLAAALIGVAERRMEIAIGTFGTVAGIAVAVALFALGWWLVGRARKGNATVRRAHNDPHLDRTAHGADEDDPQRNIPQ